MTRLGFHLTDRCPLDCDHCFRDPGKNPTDIPIAVIERFLAVSTGLTRVSFTGGEPSQHPRFGEILDLVAAHGLPWDMVSSGHRFSRVVSTVTAVPERLRSWRGVTFSLDGSSASTHDSVRGSGQWVSVLSAMAGAVGLGVPFDTTTVIHAKNADDLESIAACALELGANSVRFAMMQPTGTALDAEFFLEPDAWRDVLRRIHVLAARGLNVTTADGWPVERPSGACAPLQNGILHVGVNGRLSLCCNLSGAPREDEKPDSAEIAALTAAEAMVRLADITVETRDVLKESRRRSHPWSDFECNSCARHHGRPFWQDSGASGPMAARARWRKRPHRLPLLPS